MKDLVNIGFETFVKTEHLIGIIDAKTKQARDLVNNLKETKPNFIFDVTKRRGAVSLVVMVNGAVFVSAIPRKNLARRMGLFDDDVDEFAPRVQPRRRRKRNVQTTDSGSKTEIS